MGIADISTRRKIYVLSLISYGTLAKSSNLSELPFPDQQQNDNEGYFKEYCKINCMLNESL